jgi:hypothetical protein
MVDLRAPRPLQCVPVVHAVVTLVFGPFRPLLTHVRDPLMMVGRDKMDFILRGPLLAKLSFPAI